MTKQEEIREGIEELLENWLGGTAYSLSKKLSVAVVEYLHLQGVVIRVDRELPKPFTASWVDWGEDDILKVAEWDTRKALKRAGYVAVESLVEE